MLLSLAVACCFSVTHGRADHRVAVVSAPAISILQRLVADGIRCGGSPGEDVYNWRWLNELLRARTGTVGRFGCLEPGNRFMEWKNAGGRYWGRYGSAYGGSQCPGAGTQPMLGMNLAANPSPPPTQRPTRRPTSVPSAAPTRNPTRRPTSVPSAAPTRSPTRRPTRPPTMPPTLPPSAAPTNGFVCTPCIEPGSCDAAVAVDGVCPDVCPNPEPPAEESAGLTEEEVVVVAATATTAAGCCAVFALVWFFCPKSCIASKMAKKARSMSMRKREGEDGPGKTTAFENPIYGDGDEDGDGATDEGGGFGDTYLEVGQDGE